MTQQWSADLVLTTRKHTCCQCCTIGVLLRGQKKVTQLFIPPVNHKLVCTGGAVADCFQQVCQLLFQSVLMGGGTGHCSNPKNGWTMTLRAVTLRCNNDPHYPELNESEIWTGWELIQRIPTADGWMMNLNNAMRSCETRVSILFFPPPPPPRILSFLFYLSLCRW